MRMDYGKTTTMGAYGIIFNFYVYDLSYLFFDVR